MRDFLTMRGYDGAYYPGITPGELNRFNVLQEEAYHDPLCILDDHQALTALPL